MIQLIFPGQISEVTEVEDTRVHNILKEQDETPVWLEKPEKIGDALRVFKMRTVDNPER